MELSPEQDKVTLLDLLRQKLIYLRVNWTPCILDSTLHYLKEEDRVPGCTDSQRVEGCGL